MKRQQQTLEALLAPAPSLTASASAPKRKKLPTPESPATRYALKVYRCQLVEERTLAVKRLTVSSASQCAAVVWDYLDSADREVFVSLMMDRSNTLLGIHTVAVGDHDGVNVSIREVYKAALLVNAERLVVAHNHVLGPVKPSSADKKLTRVLARAGRMLDIELCDHVIIGKTPKEWFSMAAAGLVPE